MSLPQEYIKLKYIASTGTQWIDTDKYCTADDIISVTGKFDTFKTSHILGCHSTGTYRGIIMDSVSGVFKFIATTGYWNESSDGAAEAGCIANVGYPVCNADLDKHTFTYKYVRNSLTIDDIEYPLFNGLNDSSSNRSWPAPVEYRNNTMVLFGYRHDSFYEIYNIPDFKMESCTITQQGVITRDYIPALRKSDMKPGLYDLVSSTFFTNNAQSGDDFAYELESYKTDVDSQNNTYKSVIFSGSTRSIVEGVEGSTEYLPLEWIGSTGTQYIITDIIPTLSYSIEVKAQKEVSTGLFGMGDNTYTLTGKDSYGNYFYVGRDSSASSDRQYVTVGDLTAVHIWGIKNGVGYCDSTSAIGPTGTTQPSQALSFFGRQAQGVVSDLGTHRIYYAKIRDENGNLVGDFVPKLQLSTGKPGLYNKVTNTFFPNGGTGEFTYELISYKNVLYKKGE